MLAGLATGFEIEALLKEAEGDHEYAVPPDAFKVVLPPGHIDADTPALAVGRLLTFTITSSVDEHPFDVTETVYVVVEDGVAVGEDVVAFTNVAAGDQV